MSVVFKQWKYEVQQGLTIEGFTDWRDSRTEVHVVQSHTDGTGGFHWYPDEDTARRAFTYECVALSGTRSSIRLTCGVMVPEGLAPTAITELLDDNTLLNWIESEGSALAEVWTKGD